MHENMKGRTEEKTHLGSLSGNDKIFFFTILEKKSAKKTKVGMCGDQWRNLLLPYCIGRKCKLFVVIEESEAGKPQLLLWK